MSLVDGEDPLALEDSIASLSVRLAEEQGNRREERFLWVVLVTILFDIIALGSIDNVALPIAILVLELLALVILARKLGIRDTAAVVDRMASIVATKAKAE